VEERLHQSGFQTVVLDGDNVRHGLCGDLGFSNEDRSENLRRIGEMSKLFIEAGLLTLNAFISPFRVDRERIRKFLQHGDMKAFSVSKPASMNSLLISPMRRRFSLRSSLLKPRSPQRP
jgi:adenylylsulfate kinase